jgi:hypothetical protein
LDLGSESSEEAEEKTKEKKTEQKNKHKDNKKMKMELELEKKMKEEAEEKLAALMKEFEDFKKEKGAASTGQTKNKRRDREEMEDDDLPRAKSKAPRLELTTAARTASTRPVSSGLCVPPICGCLIVDRASAAFLQGHYSPVVQPQFHYSPTFYFPSGDPAAQQQAVFCPRMHLNPATSSYCNTCGLPLAQ